MGRPRIVRTPGATEPAADQAPEPVENNLPDESEVDPLTIKKPVLTKQGWVCPASKLSERTPQE